MDIKNKHVLLTNIYLEKYQGSEINCLSIAQLLCRWGAIVEIATLSYDFPIKAEFQKLNLRVKNILTEQLDRSHYDLIWAHHSVVLDNLIFRKGVTADKIICSSLSPFEPLESLPGYANQVSLCLVNSVETKEKALSESVEEEMCLVFPNYIMEEHLYQTRREYGTGVQRIAIVSNHIPEEIKDAAGILREKGITVDIYGLGYQVCLITPELIQKYDAVITIGKTVQYAIGTNVPVYCYDIHGGPGWLNSDVLELAYKYNFSGRGFSKKTGTEIADEILADFPAAVSETPFLYQFCKDNCVLEHNLQKVLNRLEGSPNVSLKEIKKRFAFKARENDAFMRMYGSYTAMEKAASKAGNISQELVNARGHIELLLQSERDLQADVKCKEGHIEQLLQSERVLLAENAAQADQIRKFQFELGYQTAVADLLRQSEAELRRQLEKACRQIDSLQYRLGAGSDVDNNAPME